MLKGWYPLTNDLTNNGLTSYTASGNYTVDNYGKIGKCLKFNSTINTNIPMTEWNINETSVSMGGWFKFPSSEINTLVSSYTYDSSHPNMVGTLIGYNHYGGLALIISTNSIYQDGSYKYLIVNNTLRQGGSVYNSGPYVVSFDTWVHIMGVCDRQYLYLYVNGELISKSNVLPTLNTVTTNGYFSICRDSIYGGNGPGSCFPVYANDIRLYDEALSPKQIKLLSQGLVLHYTLGDPFIEDTTNLITTEDCLSSTCYNGATSKYGYGSNSDMYKTVTTFDGKKGTKVYMGTNGNSAYPYVYVNNMYTSNGTNSPEYKTLSFDYYTTISTSISPYKLGSGSGTATYKVVNDTVKTGTGTDSVVVPVKPNTWNHIEITFHGTTNADSQWGYIQNQPSHTSNTENFWFFANMQLEAKDHATGYTKYGTSRNETTVYDVSGYGNNGTKEGELSCSSDTPRYNTSTYFDGTDNHCIAVPFANVINSTSPFTINLWWKKTEIGSKNYETLFGGAGSPNFEMDTRAGSSTTLSLYMASVRGTQYSPFNLNEWYMVTMVSDRTNEFYYVNGQLVKTIEAKGMPTGIYRIGAWTGPTSQNYKGYISDFRIYATALSADDILELYNTPISLTSNGVLMTQGELSEV